MRRWLSIAVLIIALATLHGLPVRAADPLPYTPVGPKDIYLALGDSLATGDEDPANTALETPPLPGYPAGVYRLLSYTRPISYTNLGVSGETSTSMRTAGGQLDSAVAYIAAQRAAGKVVSPVTLDIGGNDMVGVFLGGGGMTITDTLPLFRSNLVQILDSLLGAMTVNGQRTGDLLLMNYYNPYPDLTIVDAPPLIDLPPGQGPIVTNGEVPRFNQVIAEEAAARGIPVYDAYSAFAGRQGQLLYVRIPYLFFPFAQSNFDYHPRPAGHAVLARGFAATSGYVVPKIYVPVLAK